MSYKQCDMLRAKETIVVHNPVTNRRRTIKGNSLYWITSTSIAIERDQSISIAKKGESMGNAISFTMKDIQTYFERMES